MIGFVTGNTKGEVASSIPKSMVNVFVPTTPNPTSGFLLFCPRNELVFLKMTVEEAVKLVVSAGIVTPPSRGNPKGPVVAKKRLIKKLSSKNSLVGTGATKKAVAKIKRKPKKLKNDR